MRYQMVAAGIWLFLWSAACVADSSTQPARLGQVHRFGSAMHTAEAVSATVVAQNGTGDEQSLTILAGAGNTTGIIEVPGSGQNLSTLQVVLRTASQEVSIDMVTIGFGDQIGDEDFVDTMRVQLLIDTNADGLRDAGDTDLGTRTTIGFVDTITFDQTPPLVLPANSDTILLVLLDLNSPGVQTARRSSQQLAWLSRWGLLLPAIFVLLAGRRRGPHTRRPYLPFLLVVIVWSVIVSGCSGKDGDDELMFIVNLPSNGLTNQTVRLGPTQAISGATIRVTPGP